MVCFLRRRRAARRRAGRWNATFFGWLAQRRALLFNPAEGLKLGDRSTPLPKAILTETEMLALLNAPGTDALGLRDRAILETLYSTGLRRAELCGLNPYDLDFPGEVVLVRQGKGGRDRVVPIGKVALAAVRHVQLILSHASVATTQIYTRVAVDDLVAAHRRHHPRNYLHIPLQLK